MSNGLRAKMALAREEFRYTHSLGQNFIFDDMLVSRIVDASGVTAGTNVLEIGPGAGVMTAELASRGANVLAVEVDRSLGPILNEMTDGFMNVRVVFDDILKCDLLSLTHEAFHGEAFSVVANLPYYITADVVLRLLRAKLPLESITIMVQKEAAERMMASPGEKAYCALAATVQYFGKPTLLMRVPPEVFTPRPHVDSCLLGIELYREKVYPVADESMLLRLIGASFAMRRKTLANNLSAAFGVSRGEAVAWVERAGLDAHVRGEALTLEQLARLADAF